MAQWWRARAALEEDADLDSAPTWWLILVRTSPSRRSYAHFWPPWAPDIIWCTDIAFRQNTQTSEIIFKRGKNKCLAHLRFLGLLNYLSSNNFILEMSWFPSFSWFPPFPQYCCYEFSPSRFLGGQSDSHQTLFCASCSLPLFSARPPLVYLHCGLNGFSFSLVTIRHFCFVL